MKTKAAVLWEVNAPWSVEEIELDPPGPGEVLVKLAASGMCHSDEHLVTGDMVPPPEALEMMGLTEFFPVIGGHEGAGVIAEVGNGVPEMNVAKAPAAVGANIKSAPRIDRHGDHRRLPQDGHIGSENGASHSACDRADDDSCEQISFH
jgi:D-arabinose 1-dehydrogenase-like Zn-dependent alcohol dehydrogenase